VLRKGRLTKLPTSMTASQASLNELVAAMIRAGPGDSRWTAAALSALREHNWAAGFPFEGAHPAPGLSREYHAKLAAAETRFLEIARDLASSHAKLRAEIEARWGQVPEETAALLRRSGADAPALVYVITHTALGAAKIGVSDPAGARIAQHRRAGWQLIAAFRVAAGAAAAIEADVLGWWRGRLDLPSYLGRDQMPQGGWTETVATGSVDLAATVKLICDLAIPAWKAE
jgi:hypothetical protein